MPSSSELTQVFLTEKPCGCYYETSLDITGEVALIRARTCSKCFDEFYDFLDQQMLDRDAQLTLELPSRRTPEGKE